MLAPEPNWANELLEIRILPAREVRAGDYARPQGWGWAWHRVQSIRTEHGQITFETTDAQGRTDLGIGGRWSVDDGAWMEVARHMELATDAR